MRKCYTSKKSETPENTYGICSGIRLISIFVRKPV